MLAAVTIDNPPLARDIQQSRRLPASALRSAWESRIRQTAAVTAAVISVMTVAVTLLIILALTLVSTVVNVSRNRSTWPSPKHPGRAHPGTARRPDGLPDRGGSMRPYEQVLRNYMGARPPW
jgi:hypothetical protein